MLKRRGIKHELLNALPEHAARESEIVAQAGRIGAVTIATNMAGRGTDIILGGNPETLAWAQLKDKYASRLDVPEDEWKHSSMTSSQREKMKEEGRKVAEMGGLHIIGTERHDARRIDNQLRGRAGRQGDPGSSRFYLSLEDDLMRIFAGEWVSGLLHAARHGGRASHREPHGVAPHRRPPRKRSRNAISTAARTCSNTTRSWIISARRFTASASASSKMPTAKSLCWKCSSKQIDMAVDEYLRPRLRREPFRRVRHQSCSAWNSKPADFRGVDFDRGREGCPRTSRCAIVDTHVHEMIDENLGSRGRQGMELAGAGQPGQRAMESQGLDRQLKQIGKDDMARVSARQGRRGD